ncbi:aminotransferase class III-fold pyridoxal phosphate-dependent enzyme [bacterium]|nr:aminotransferase class III-fold pyridoxal phosphate-dependent enzyme [bacterium]
MNDFPKTESKKYLDEFAKYIVMEPKPFVIDLSNSKGMFVKTVDGDDIFDWGGYYGSRLIGHNHPYLYQKEYLDELIPLANNRIANPDFLTPQCVSYYRKLYEIAPKCMKNERLELYVLNSGAEAVENMMKYLINLFNNKIKDSGITPTKRRFIYFDQSFHGRTGFALNITNLNHDPICTKDFEGIIPGNIKVPFPALNSDLSEEENLAIADNSLQIIDKILKKYHDEVVGIIIEPIQGAGGHRCATPYFFRELSLLSHKYDVYLGFDEVQTAGGQTGEIFAVDLFNLPYPPQAIATGKKFSNGVVFMLHSMKDIGVLDSTWGGNLVDMFRFVKEWSVVEDENLLSQVEQKSNILVEKLNLLKNRFPNFISNIRGLGLYQGFTLINISKADFIERALKNESLLLIGAGVDTIRLRPPLDVTESDIELFYKKLKNIFLSF